MIETFKASLCCDALGIEDHEIDLEIEWSYEKPEPTISGGFDIHPFAFVVDGLIRGCIYFSQNERAHILYIIENRETDKHDEDDARRQAEAEEERRGL